MFEQVVTAGIGVAILGGAYLIDLLIGIAKVMFTPDLRWSWGRAGRDFAKAIVMAIGIVGFVAVLNVIRWYGTLVGADLSFLGETSFPVLITSILGGCAWYLSGAMRNIVKFVNSNNVSVTLDEAKIHAGTHEIARQVTDWWAKTFTRPEVIEAQKEFEQNPEESGRGAFYAVDVSSYNAFRSEVLGKSYDIDGAYGAQCWDGACLLWQQLGRRLSTGGSGAARGCWTLDKIRNAGTDFELIHNFADLSVGDVVVFNSGIYGHIAFVDSTSPLRILGQNQTGTGNGAPFNIIDASARGFLGAFRFKKWHQQPAPTPTPTPAPAPTSTPTKAAINVGDSVIAWGAGTADSYGGGAQTADFAETTMRVIAIANGRYALNQYNEHGAVTGWWPAEQVRRA